MLSAQGEYKAPESETEIKLTKICEELLKLDKNTLSVDANFFEIGGHSLLATRLVNLMTQEFGIRVPLKTVFEEKTIVAISQVVEESVITLRNKHGRDSDREFIEMEW